MSRRSNGVALGATQRNASASVPGAFAYSPGAGVEILLITFDPADSVNYAGAGQRIADGD